jgi:outer membrane protein assembly factor BamB
VEGWQFTPNEAVDISFDGTPQGQATPSPSKNFQFSFPVPGAAPSGPHPVEVRVGSKFTRGLTFTVFYDWPKFNYGPTNSSHNPYEDLLTVQTVTADPSKSYPGLVKKWSYTPPPGTMPSDETFNSDDCPVVVGGRIYVGSSEGKLYAIYLDSYKEPRPLWDSGRNIPGGHIHSPAVANEKVYVVNQYGDLFCFAAGDGRLLERTTNLSLYTAPVVADGVVYAASQDATLYALDPDTLGVINFSPIPPEKDSSGNLVPANISITGSPAVADGKVYLCTNRYLYAIPANPPLAPQPWDPTWSYRPFTDSYAQSPPVVAGDRVLVVFDGKLYAINPQSVNPYWDTSKSSYSITSNPVVDNDRVYVIGGGYIRALLLTDGAEKYHLRVDNSASEISPAVANGVLYLGPGNGKLQAFNTATGDSFWESELSDTDDCWQMLAPAVSDGMVYVACGNAIHAFGVP